MKLNELFHEWLYDNHHDVIKPKSFMRYEQTYRINVAPYYGEIDIETITPRDIQQWINEMKHRTSETTKKALSPASINIAILVLKMCFNYSVDFEILEKSPMTRIKNVPIDRHNKVLRVFTREEQIKFEKYVENKQDDEFFVYILTLYTGLRLGEVMAITWKDINLKSGIMSVNKSIALVKTDNGEYKYVTSMPKTKNSIREIPLPMFLREKMKIMKKEKKSQYVIVKNNGERLTDKIVVWRFTQMIKKLKLRHLSFHSLRHTFATRALEMNMDIKTLSEILGHADIGTTLNIYTHSLINHKRQQMRKMKRII